MKAFTLKDPWATLAAWDLKGPETRSRGTKYRGPLAIHSSLKLDDEGKTLFYREPFRAGLASVGITEPYQMKRGCVLAVVQLVDCFEMTTEWIATVPEPHRSFGVYEPGRWAWIIRDAERLPEPKPARGALGLWNWEPA